MAVDWLEVTVNTTPDNLDGLCAQLEDLGVGGLIIEDTDTYTSFLEENRQYWDYIDEALQTAIQGLCRVKFYVEDSSGGRGELARLQAALPGEPFSARSVRDEDWENNWKAFYKPMEVGKRLWVVPEWEAAAPPAGRMALRLDPGLIFGTGAHPTTQMCLRALEDLVQPGDRVLDLGCGSGILAIAALLLGAGDATGCDIDPKAPGVALENAACNGIGAERFAVYAGDVLTDNQLQKKIGNTRYSLVMANIVADVILALAPVVPRWLTPDGHFICSGIITGREREVRDALQTNGLQVLQENNQEDWYSFVCCAAKE